MSYRELFSSLLATSQIQDDPIATASYGTDTAKDFTGSTPCVLFPRSTEEVKQIIDLCNQHQIPLVPSGGRTGLCGGATALRGEVVLSLEKLDTVYEIDRDSRMVRCQSGVVTEKLQQQLKEVGLMFPLAIASQGSSQIGGNIATNAGGMHVIHYGSIRSWVIGMQVVTGSGTVLNIGRPLYKNQTGYDLKHLFIGSEGTLGVITELTLALAELPQENTVAVFSASRLEDLLTVLSHARKLPGSLYAFEFFTDKALELVIKHRGLSDPFQKRSPFYGLIEFGSSPARLSELCEEYLLPLIEEGVISDMVIAQSLAQSKSLLALRESISETVSSHYICHKNDISVPVPKTPEFLRELVCLLEREAPTFIPVLFGHLGDGNIHVNWLNGEKLSRDEFFKESHRIDHQVMHLVDSLGGSVSAEHGIGLLKKDFLALTRTAEEIEYMRAIKALFDPKGIMNPGKVFDSIKSPRLNR